MIICSVCQTENDQFVSICKKCGGFLQNRIPNLDLFDVLWKIIETPRNAFRLIIRAEHKNYALFLYTLSGIAVTFAGFWHFKLGNRFENILLIIFPAILIGLLIGIALCPIASSLHWGLSKILGNKSSFLGHHKLFAVTNRSIVTLCVANRIIDVRNVLLHVQSASYHHQTDILYAAYWT